MVIGATALRSNSEMREAGEKNLDAGI